MTASAAPTLQGLVVFAKDKARVSAFYQQTLLLAVVESERTHDLLQGAGVEVVVHAIPAGVAKAIHISQPPEPREDTPFKPTFVVSDLNAVRVAVEATGGWLKAANKAWHFRGATVLDGHDPEGNIVQFKQLDAA